MDALDVARALLSSGHSQDHRSFNPGEDRENGVIVGLSAAGPRGTIGESRLGRGRANSAAPGRK